MNINDIIKSKDDKNNLFLKIFEKYNILDCDRPLSAIRCYVPLPTRFELNEFYNNKHKITKNDNEYMFKGSPGNRIMFGDVYTPFFISKNYKAPCPFSFPVNNNIILSNIYYYEVTLLNKKNINNDWPSACISIGFADKSTPINSHIGWYNNSIGFHSDDGTIRFNNTKNSDSYTRQWIPGDTIGAGLIYVNKCNVIPFFTFNGMLIYKNETNIFLKLPYFPAIGYDHMNSIKVNFSSEPFKFDITKLINKYSDNVISTENSFIKDYNCDPIATYQNYKKNLLISQFNNQFYSILDQSNNIPYNSMEYSNPIYNTAINNTGLIGSYDIYSSSVINNYSGTSSLPLNYFGASGSSGGYHGPSGSSGPSGGYHSAIGSSGSSGGYNGPTGLIGSSGGYHGATGSTSIYHSVSGSTNIYHDESGATTIYHNASSNIISPLNNSIWNNSTSSSGLYGNYHGITGSNIQPADNPPLNNWDSEDNNDYGDDEW